MTSMFGRVARSVAIGRVLVGAVALFSIGFVIETFASAAPLWQEALYVVLGLALAYGAFVHVLCHYGYVARLRDRAAEPGSEDVARAREVRFGALIPSYREEPEFVYRAMLSVALQRHDDKWLRLLVDDPSQPRKPEDQRLLEAARALPGQVRAFLEPLQRIADRASAVAARKANDAPAVLTQVHYDLAAHFAELAKKWPTDTADDRFFRAQVLERLANDHARDAEVAPADPLAAKAEIARLQRRFRCDVATFERKRFDNLSHAANKAMNLNTAIDLVGRRVREVRRGETLHLEDSRSGTCPIPEAEYLITLDADSLLAPDYAARLLAVITAPGAETIAVAQTPYAAQPETVTLLERIAGATTDVQRIIHQGFARYDAAFWVGANAVLRLKALHDIATEDVERGHRIRRFVQDRTPIEDTESTIDLAVKGWRVHNEDAILAWSATPPDFGALVIQRRRWACGGLIVLPKALRAALRSSAPLGQRVLQALVRAHYLGSLAWSPVALLALAVSPFDAALTGVFLPLVALPYFVAYGFDLVLSKRPFAELAAVYGLNLLLIPVNLAGALASLRQVITGRKVPFARTPKVNDRTAAPVGILAALWGGSLFLLASAASDAWLQELAKAAFAGANGIALLAAALAYIGWRATREDLLARLGPRRGKVSSTPDAQLVDQGKAVTPSQAPEEVRAAA